MSKRAANKIVAGLEDALVYSNVHRAVLDWIRDDVPLAGKMNLMPQHVNQLVDRICGSTTTVGAERK